MKKFLGLVFSMLMLVSVMLPTSILAQETTTDAVLLGVINSLKDLNSFKGEFDGTMNLLYDEGNADFVTDGIIQFKVSPEMEFGFELNLAMDAIADDGSTENENYVVKAYMVDDTIMMFEDDSADDTDGQWDVQDVATMGFNTQQIAQQYPLLISMLEGIVRSYYVPSKVHGLLSEKTEIESTNDGYSIVIHSFETEEEWIEFFDALEELEESINDEASDAVGMDLEAEIDDLDELEEQAQALADGLTYTITINTDSNYLIQSIHLVVDTDVEKMEENMSASSTESDTETPKSVTANFIYTLRDSNFDGSIDLPADLPQ